MLIFAKNSQLNDLEKKKTIFKCPPNFEFLIPYLGSKFGFGNRNFNTRGDQNSGHILGVRQAQPVEILVTTELLDNLLIATLDHHLILYHI